MLTFDKEHEGYITENYIKGRQATKALRLKL